LEQPECCKKERHNLAKRVIPKMALTLLLMLAVAAVPSRLVEALVPNEPHNANSMWIEPSLTQLNTPQMWPGYKFNVTVWANCSVPCGGWQIWLVYENAMINATRAGYTANTKSEFFQNISTIPVPPIFRAHNDTFGRVEYGESRGVTPINRDPGYGSLAWIEFNVTTVPQSPTTAALGFYGYTGSARRTYLIDASQQKVDLNVYGALVKFLPSPPWPTVVRFTLSPNPAYAGQIVTLVGTLTDEFGQGLNNTRLDAYVNGGFVGSLFTNSSGWVQASSTVSSAGTYNITIAYNGSSTYKPSSHTEILVVNPKLDTKVSFTLSPNPAKVGQTVTMLGNLTDINGAIGNAPLEVYLKVGAGPWQYSATIYTSSSGWFSVSGKVTSPGTYQIAVLYRGSYKHNLSYHVETLLVNP
jgi:hypothetical protein